MIDAEDHVSNIMDLLGSILDAVLYLLDHSEVLPLGTLNLAVTAESQSERQYNGDRS